MITLEYIQGTWDKKQGRGKYIGDQSYLYVKSDKNLEDIDDHADFMVPHNCRRGEAYFFGHSYANGELISYNHHSGPDFSVCSGKEPGHTYHNGCGYGGAAFTYNINGEEVKVVGAWSSGSYHWNEIHNFADQVHDGAVYVPKYTHTAMGVSVKLSTLLQLMIDTDYVIVRGLGVGDEFVHRNDVKQFIENAGIWPKRIPGDKWKWRRWSTQKTEEDVLNDIKNAIIIDPRKMLRMGLI